MPSDLHSLFNRFDDPPMTLRGVLGGVGLLIALLLAVGHRHAVLAFLLGILDALVAVAPAVLLAAGIVGLYAWRARLLRVRLRTFLLHLGLALGLSFAALVGIEAIAR